MIKKLENYKFSLEKILKSLAKQDFNTAVDGIDSLISDIDYILTKKKIAKQNMVKKDDLNDLGTNGLPDSSDSYLFTKEIDISDIENTQIKEIYLRNGGTVYRYNFENRNWFLVEDNY